MFRFDDLNSIARAVARALIGNFRFATATKSSTTTR